MARGYDCSFCVWLSSSAAHVLVSVSSVYGVNTSCDLKGLVCIFDKWERLNTLQPHWSGETNLNCDCPSGCDELELDVVFSSSGT
ncbi:unnamed protein product, partial [Timema podura]|nr:unnamed protein product [Timema podura]